MNIISDQRLGELVGLLGSASDGLPEHLIMHQFDRQPQTVDEDKAQCDIIDALRELAEARRVVATVKACEGVRNCIKMGCASCRHHSADCNSLAVVTAVKVYNERTGSDE